MDFTTYWTKNGKRASKPQWRHICKIVHEVSFLLW